MSSVRSYRTLFAAGAFLTACTLGLPPLCRAGGLRCSIGEVMVENLGIGQEHSLKELANLPLLITNTGDQSVLVRVEPVVPAAEDLRYGAAPIPDISWVSAEEDSFELAPQATESVNLRIRVPDDPRLLGAKFQVGVWSHTLPQPGVLVACGLNSRVIFGINPVREDPGSAPTGGISVLLTPAEVTLRDVSPGHQHSLVTDLDQPLVLKNPSAEPVLVELQMLSNRGMAAGLPDGFEDLIEFARVEFSPARVQLQPGETKVVSGTVRFLPGKTPLKSALVGVVSAQVVGRNVTTGLYARIYAPAP